MGRIIAWSLWAVLPVFGLAFHYGPGQALLRRDLATSQLEEAELLESKAEELQLKAYETQFATLAVREALQQEDTEANRALAEQHLQAEQQAYAAASDAWMATAERYQQVETLLEGTPAANQVRLMRGRALVRAGQVFNGIDDLEATLAAALEQVESGDDPAQLHGLVDAAREELAAAHYYGARLLREEGRAADVWKQVSETSRQQFRYLAERAGDATAGDAALNLQRNLERVLDLEQLDRSELVGRPIPKDSPRARRPGDGEPQRRRPGKGPPRGDQPNRGAGDLMDIGDGW